MDFEFKVYLHKGKEYFEYTSGQTLPFVKEVTKKNFDFAQSLLELLYLDIWSYGELFETMGKDIRRLLESKDAAYALSIKRSLDTLAGVHIFFELLRLDWYERLETAERKKYIGISELLPVKKITHIPSNIQAIQEQIKKLFSNVLDVLSPNEPVQKKMVNFYSEHSSNSLELFQFQPQPTNFEMVAGDIFTEVLYPNDIYDMIDFFLRACIKKEHPFRVCKSCGKYFAVTGYINTEYCDREFMQTGKSCKEIGATKSYQKKINSDPIINAYNKAYKKHFAWIRYHKITREAFYVWSEQARNMRDKCIDGEIDFEKFKDWLKA
jgi:hypothetical protein